MSTKKKKKERLPDLPHKEVKSPTMTFKRRKFLKAFIETGNQTEAALAAYNVTDRVKAGDIGSKVMAQIKEGFPELMDRLGLTDEKVLGTILHALDAENSYYSKAKQDIVTVPDWNSRLKAADITLKLKNKYPKAEAEVEHNFNFVISRGEETKALPTIVVEEQATGATNEGIA